MRSAPHLFHSENPSYHSLAQDPAKFQGRTKRVPQPMMLTPVPHCDPRKKMWRFPTFPVSGNCPLLPLPLLPLWLSSDLYYWNSLMALLISLSLSPSNPFFTLFQNSYS